MKIRPLIGTTLVVVALALGATTPSFAASDMDLEGSTLVSTGSGSATSSPADVVTLAQLQEVRLTQSSDDVAAVIATASERNRVSVLVDSGEYVAAIAIPQPRMTPQAITPLGPGCSTISACIYPYNGYIGTGVLQISVYGNQAFAGDHGTGFWIGNTINWAAPWVTLNWTFTQHFTTITRS